MLIGPPFEDPIKPTRSVNGTKGRICPMVRPSESVFRPPAKRRTSRSASMQVRPR